jgi:hypothetical protein
MMCAAAAAACFGAGQASATLMKWTLHDVTFSDGASASGFVEFDPSVPYVPQIGSTPYLTSFDVHVSGGSTLGSYDFTPANTDAFVPYYISFFSAPEGPTPRHGLPQRFLRLYASGGWPKDGGVAPLLGDASWEQLTFADHSTVERDVTGGWLEGAPLSAQLSSAVPEPATLAFLGAALLLLRARRNAGINAPTFPRAPAERAPG